jgi:hypothetical protein
MWAENEALKAYAFNGSLIDPSPVQRSTVVAPWNAMPGGALALSASGGNAGSGVVWAAIPQYWDATNTSVDGVLRAFDAEDVSHELWNSDRDSGDFLGLFAKFAPPTVANGKVYVGTFSGAIRVYGLRSGSTDPSPSPYGGTPAPIPGVVQAENFDNGGESIAYHDTTAENSGGEYRSTGVDIESSGDGGGGYNVGWMQAGEWLKYTVAVASAGTYVLEARVASEGAGGRFHIEVDGADATGPLTIPDTGGWQTWQTAVKNGVVLAAGAHQLRLVVDSNGASGSLGNVNFVRFTTGSSSTGSTPFNGAAVSLPGTIKAENFDNGGEGLAYHDDTPGNSGGAYRSTDVDIESSEDTGGGYNIGWLHAGEWLTYSVNVTSAGPATATIRVASAGSGGTFHLELNGVNITGPLTIPVTGGWQSWVNVTAAVTLPAGAGRLRFVADAASGSLGNLRSIAFSGASGPAALVVAAADFDNGGEGVSSHDTTPGNEGGAYRNTNVDIEASSEGGYDVGWIAAGEWLNYTVNIAAGGNYVAQFRVASPNGSASMHVGFNGGSNVWQSIAIPKTGDWQAWTTVSLPVTLSAGSQQLTLTFDTSGFNISRITIAKAP